MKGNHTQNHILGGFIVEEKDAVIVDKKEDELKTKIVAWAMLTVTAILSYKLGKKVNGNAVNRGFKVLFDADPDFKSRYIDAYSKAIKNKLG